MNSKYRLILMILFSVVIVTIFRVLTRDKKLSSPTEYKKYSLFESTLKIQTPFELKEEEVENPKPDMIDKAWGSSYESKNGFFIISAYKLRKGAKISTLDKSVELLLAYIDKSRDAHSKVNTQDSVVINNVHFKKFIGVQILNSNDLINKRENYNFDVLVTSNSRYSYLIYMDENINNSDAQTVKEKIFSSITIAQ